MNSFAYDLAFLKKKDENLIILSNNCGKSQIIVSPNYQGKVLTSTANGLEGKSFGYINYKAFNSLVSDEHINVYGGENRFWLGPEGGIFSVFFLPEKNQVFENWHTPKAIDTESWNLLLSDSTIVLLEKTAVFPNALGNNLEILLNRKIQILSVEEIEDQFQITLPKNVNIVAYRTENSIKNMNSFEWTMETGTVCIWMLDMLHPSSDAITIVPYNQSQEHFSEIAKTDYFGKIPPERIIFTNDKIYLKTDGKYRCKIGLGPLRSCSLAANYDPQAGRLTIVTFTTSKNACYLNQEWDTKAKTYDGDVFNAYNDGPLEDGTIMGPFLELKSSSPAAFLKPEEKLLHTHSVFHFSGDEVALSEITNKLLGISIQQIKKTF